MKRLWRSAKVSNIFDVVDLKMKAAGLVLVRTSAGAGSRYYGKSALSKKICVTNHPHRRKEMDSDLHDTIVVQSWSDPDFILAWCQEAIQTFHEKGS